MDHPRYNKLELAALLKIVLTAWRDGRLPLAAMINLNYGIVDALNGSYGRLWRDLALWSKDLKLSDNGRLTPESLGS